MLNRKIRISGYGVVTAALIAAICAAIAFFYLTFYNQIGNIYQAETESMVLDLKKVFLKSTIDNLIYEIDLDRKLEAQRYGEIVDCRYDALSLQEFADEEDFYRTLIAKFESDFQEGNDYWTVFLWNDQSGQVLYDPGKLLDQDIEGALEKVKPLLAHYRLVTFGELSCLFGVSRQDIDRVVKEEIGSRIRQRKFDNDSYLWINEILNYEGGDNYAIRRIHPNLPETEGMFLSTAMQDIKGNLPYLTELEGIKKDGQLFYQYYFKELNSERISEKISYAKLYKDYNWVLCMGMPLNEMDQYIAQVNERGRAMTAKNAFVLSLALILVVAFCLTLLLLVERWRFKCVAEKLELEIHIDPITSVGNRRYGVKSLMRAFDQFKIDGVSPAVMMFDLDHFKEINDTWGHDVGDRILQEITAIVCGTIRSTDQLIRWGGDEFVGIIYGMKTENTEAFAQKVREAISSIKIAVETGEISPTVSIGISYFKEEDADYSSALKKADQAMYVAKTEGRNRICILP